MDSKELSEYVGNQIRRYRKQAGLTQKELGNKIGVKHNTVSDYENGKISPEQDTLFAISELLNIRIDDLFPPKDHNTDHFQEALKLSRDLELKDMEFLNSLIEKTLSLDEGERERFLESIRFTVEYYDKMNKE